MNVGADVQVINVTRSFCHQGGQPPVDVLRGVSLHVKMGECVAVTGPSGSGKTTLLQMIGAMDRPDSGEIQVNGCALETLGESARARFRNRDIGFIFQAHHLLPQLTVFENVMVPVWGGAKSSDYLDRAHVLLKRVGLEKRLTHFPGHLSGGERQRVAVVRALILQPRLVLADEPTGALDQHAAQELMQMLLQINEEEHTTLIVVTHSEASARLMMRCVSLKDGKIETAYNV